jgi:hypothetical protein
VEPVDERVIFEVDTVTDVTVIVTVYRRPRLNNIRRNSRQHIIVCFRRGKCRGR